MAISFNVTIRLKLVNQPGMLAQVLAVIAAEGGNLGSIDVISVEPGCVVRELMVGFSEQKNMANLVAALEEIPGVVVEQVADRVFTKHLGGKMEIKARSEIFDREDLSLVYTPGVARASQAIADDPELVYQLTIKGNSVAIVTDGTAVLGLGDIGPEAALPVMEGKALLFKKFGGIDAMPLCLNVHSIKEIVDTVVACAPTFGGINLEDIAAPQCFAIEEELVRRLDIPVFHDDQHGTAIVVTAGLINALRVVGKNIDQVKIVINGAGAAGVAITKMLLVTGARDIIICDRNGAISRDNLSAVSSKKWLAEHTNEVCVHGSLPEVIGGADVFIGVSGPGLLHRENILHMAEKPVIFALANPVPEVDPGEIQDIAGVIATGRSDFPNQINNVLAFPGVFRGALDCHARAINDAMCLAAARVLADLVPAEQLSAEYIIPSVFHEGVCQAVSNAVQQAAKETGVSRRYRFEEEQQNKMLVFNAN